MAGGTSQPLRLDDRVVIVTGAGRGLGRAHALALADRGARVVVNDVVAEDEPDVGAVSTARMILKRGGEAVPCVGSVAEDAVATQAVECAHESFGPVDTVVNNAGIAGPMDLTETTAEDLRRHYDVHLVGSFNLIKAAWADLGASGTGRVVNTTSGVGLLGFRRSFGYASAKAAVLGLTRTLAVDGAPHGVNANAVAPLARTPMAKNNFGDLTAILHPEYVSALVVWLAHPDCAVSGEVFSAGGGRVARWMLGVTEGIYDEADSPEIIRDRFDELRQDDRFVPLPEALSEIELVRRARDR